MNNTTFLKVIDAAAAATNSGYIDTHNFNKINIEVIYDGDAVDSAFTITFYGSVDGTADTRYALGVSPSITGTRDADGAIAFNEVDSTVLYDVTGVHPYIYIAISGVTDDIVVTVNIIGQEII